MAPAPIHGSGTIDLTRIHGPYNPHAILFNSINLTGMFNASSKSSDFDC